MKKILFLYLIFCFLGTGVFAESFPPYPIPQSLGLFTTSIQAGSTFITSCTTGDGCFARSTTGGAIALGGSSKSCTIDYNITTTNYLTYPCSKAQITAASGNANWQVNNTGPGNTNIQYTATTGTVNENLVVTTSTTPSPGPNTFAAITFNDLAYAGNTAMGALWGGIADHGDGTHGGYFLINTTTFGASPTVLEAVQVTPGGHVGMPQNVIQASITSPSTCAALTCGATYTETFSYPYVTNSGSAQNPVCVAPSIEDSTSPSTIWVANVVAGSETSTTVQYNYSPVVATVSAHSLVITMTCYQGVF